MKEMHPEYLIAFFMLSVYNIVLTVCLPPGGLAMFVLVYMWAGWVFMLMLLTNIFEKEREP